MDIDFKKPAIYKIVVKGEIVNGWPERLWGLQVHKEKEKDRIPISSLVGQIADQSALSGILNMLYEKHLILISVNMLSEIESELI
jgi:hypothetical protein